MTTDERWRRLKRHIRYFNQSLRREKCKCIAKKYRINDETVPDVLKRLDTWETILWTREAILSEMARLEKEER